MKAHVFITDKNTSPIVGGMVFGVFGKFHSSNSSSCNKIRRKK